MAHERDAFAGGEGEVDAVQDGAAFVGFPQAVRADDGFGRWRVD